MRAVLKVQVPVDDGWHEVQMTDRAPLHVASQSIGTVSLWFESAEPPVWRRLRVFGTGQPLPAEARHVGTALAGPLVWHVYEAPPTI